MKFTIAVQFARRHSETELHFSNYSVKQNVSQKSLL